MPRMNLEGSSSVITGGASGIGEASARQLAAAGAHVVIADLNEEKGQAVASELGGLFVKCDVSSTDDADAASPPPRRWVRFVRSSTPPASATPVARSTATTSRST